MAQNYRKTHDKQNTGKPRRDMDGQNWRELKWNCIWVNLKKTSAHLFQIYNSLYQNVIYTAGNSVIIMWP